MPGQFFTRRGSWPRLLLFRRPIYGSLSEKSFDENSIAGGAGCTTFRLSQRLMLRVAMKNYLSSTIPGCALPALLLAGCATDPNRITTTDARHPGPATGRVVGAGAGVVAGNVAGAAVGVGEGVAAGASAPFHKTTRVVRTWRTETTSDGRTIQVPVDTVVDEQGRPLNAPASQKSSGSR